MTLRLLNALVYLVNLFLTNLVRKSLGSPLFSQRSQYFQHFLPESAKNTAIAEKRRENPGILTKLVRKRLTRVQKVSQECDARGRSGHTLFCLFRGVPESALASAFGVLFVRYA